MPRQSSSCLHRPPALGPDALDPDALRLADDAPTPSARRPPAAPLEAGAGGRPIPRNGPDEPFLMGPLPRDRLARSTAPPGQALAVSLAIWQFMGMKKQNPVAFTLARANKMLGVSKQPARRGLQKLREAGLIEVRHRTGGASMVTLLSAPRPLHPAPANGGAATKA